MLPQPQAEASMQAILDLDKAGDLSDVIGLLVV